MVQRRHSEGKCFAQEEPRVCFPLPAARGGDGETATGCNNNGLFLVLLSVPGQELGGGYRVLQKPATQEPRGRG